MTQPADPDVPRERADPGRQCRFCGAPLEHVVVDLGATPLCESYLRADELDRMEPFYPLRPLVCGRCFLVQLPEYVAPGEIFGEYAYFSSHSDSWVEHARRYAEDMAARLNLDGDSLVVEVGSNDGYLLGHFVRLGIPVLGVEPAANVAAAAVSRGVPTTVAFFGEATAGELASSRGQADLVVANNVLAQVPDLNDFVAGMAVLLKPSGTLTVEFPHLQRLIEGNQFDTIYHEHFSYFSLLTAERVFLAHGLRVTDVEELPTHGGSLRLHVRHADTPAMPSHRVEELLGRELAAGYDRVATYQRFGQQVEETKRALLGFLLDLKRRGKSVAGYGAPGKANTLLNYCGIRTDFVDYTVDRNPYKQGRFTPGTRIPIFAPEKLTETRPDYVWILPWNLTSEIVRQCSYVGDWGGRFFVAIPTVTVLE